jgi:hypothetical protein
MGRKHPTLTAGLAPPSVYGPCRKPQTDTHFHRQLPCRFRFLENARFSAGESLSSVARITRVFSKEAFNRTLAELERA